MCLPNNNTSACYHIQQKISSDIILESGNSTASHSSHTTRKRSFIDMLKTALFCGAFFVVFLLRGGNAFSSPMTKLFHDLNSLDRLKKDYVDHELEILWDRQHIRELQDNIKNMEGSFKKLTETFHEEEEDLVTKNESLREALITTSSLNANLKKVDHELFSQLARQEEKVHIEYNKELEENALLKKRLAETIKEMQETKGAALRGASLQVE